MWILLQRGWSSLRGGWDQGDQQNEFDDGLVTVIVITLDGLDRREMMRMKIIMTARGTMVRSSNTARGHSISISHISLIYR